MIDGFHWTRVTAKHLRFLYEEVTTLQPPARMLELAGAIDRAFETLFNPAGTPAAIDKQSDSDGQS